MADLTLIEKRKLERTFLMGSGYVLNFSNRTFEEFILDVVGCHIYAPDYEGLGGSKANRLRAFWRIEPNQIVGTVINALLYVYVDEERETDADYSACRLIAARLQHDSPVIDIDAIVPNADGREFESLAKSVREAIEQNHPDTGLDRLHTFLMKYVRILCEKHGIDTSKDKPLHSLFGEYVEFLANCGQVESDMAKRILKSTISIFEAFNRVRNDKSLAHDNTTLGHSESILILNSVASSIRFVKSVERLLDDTKSRSVASEDDWPF